MDRNIEEEEWNMYVIGLKKDYIRPSFVGPLYCWAVGVIQDFSMSLSCILSPSMRIVFLYEFYANSYATRLRERIILDDQFDNFHIDQEGRVKVFATVAGLDITE